MYILALYSEGHARHKESDVLLQSMVENRSQFDFILFEQSVSDTYLLIFNISELNKCACFFHNNSGVLDLIGKLNSGRWPRCQYCGCYILNAYPYSYRDIGGCVGKTTECPLCIGKDNSTVSKISDKRITEGEQSALDCLISVYALSRKGEIPLGKQDKM